jgi:hypothetical protein
MMVRGFPIDALRAGSTLAMTTAPANTSGAASHTHKGGKPVPGAGRVSIRDNEIAA